MTNADRLRKLEQMGLGPVWVRRGIDAADAAAENGVGNDKPVSAPASSGDIAAMDWDMLESSIRSCTRCRLCEGRKLAVPGVGDRKARWLFVGEGPGRTEDQQGEPFVGPAGKLLDNMLRALDLDALPRQGQYDTLAGFLMVMLRRIPRRTDTVEAGGLRFEVMDVDHCKVDQVLVSRLGAPTPPA